jgi:hypothetical protein
MSTTIGGGANRLTSQNTDLTLVTASGSNLLNNFSSYNYLFTLSCLSRQDLQREQPFDVSQLRNIIASSQGNWNDRGARRVQTNFGSYDYFIDDLIVAAVIHPNEQTGNATATKLTFKVTEPYSAGLFLLTMDQGARAAGYNNYREAPYLLTIEFKGYDDQGRPDYNQQLTRYIPIKFIQVQFNITSSGAVYECEAIPYNEIAFRDQITRTLTDIRLEGRTVRDLLVGNTASLQTALSGSNTSKIQDRETRYPDEYEIHFPRDFTDRTNSGNEIANANVFNDFSGNGTVRFANQTDQFDAARQIRRMDNLAIDTARTFTFRQSARIEEIIAEIIIRSDYISNQVVDGRFRYDDAGMINWFRIESNVQDLDEQTEFGRQKRKYIYRVIPYKVHADRAQPPNATPPGYQILRRNVNRIYDYIYTGKNTEIINLTIDYKMGFFVAIPGDSANRTGTDTSGAGLTVPNDPNRRPTTALPTARVASPEQTPHTQQVGAVGRQVSGSSGSDTPETRQNRLLRDIFENPGDLVNLEVEIMGDPYYLPSSGMGNQVIPPDGTNVLRDGSMNYQSREIDIIVNLRTPLDIDPVTGLYKFSLTLDQFSGLFFIISVESRFNGGKFTQVLQCIRRRLQFGPSQSPTRQTYLTPENAPATTPASPGAQPNGQIPEGDAAILPALLPGPPPATPLAPGSAADAIRAGFEAAQRRRTQQ